MLTADKHHDEDDQQDEDNRTDTDVHDPTVASRHRSKAVLVFLSLAAFAVLAVTVRPEHVKRIAIRDSRSAKPAVFVGDIPDVASAIAAAVDAQVDTYLAALEAERVRVAEEQRVAVIIARWTAVGQCEQPTGPGGSIQWTLQSSTYSGGLGISLGAWIAAGGLMYAPNAGLATPWQQMLIAETIYSRYGQSAWGCRIP